jgi:ankyrin repeat protein
MEAEFNQENMDAALFEAFAAAEPDLGVIAGLINEGANVNAVDENGDTLLMLACADYQTEEDLDKVKLLLELGADINAEKDGLNCLFDAYRTWSPELVEMLLRAGANPNCIATYGDGALLDWVSNDLWLYKDNNLEQGGPLTRIYRLLRDYDAKRGTEMQKGR